MQFKHKQYFAFVLLYLIANLPMLLNNGLFWDDWTLYNMEYNDLMIQFYGNGFPWIGKFHYFLISNFKSPLIYNLITIASQIITFVFIVKALNKLGVKNYKWISCFVLLIPFFAVKNAMICLPYTLLLMLFFIALYALVMYLYSPQKHHLRVVALLGFYLSFYVNSLLVFYLLPLCIIYYLQENNNKFFDFKSLIYFFKKYIDFIILPVLFFIVKMLLTEKRGVYKEVGYNEINLKGLLSIPKNLLTSIDESFLGLFRELFGLDLFYRYNLLAFIVISVILYSTKIKFIKINKPKSFLCLGVLLFLIGAFPYSLVGKPPSFMGYNTRHQLLLPIGTAILFMSLINFLVKKQFIKHVYIFVISLFVLVSFKMNMKFVNSWLKQESLAVHIKENKSFIDNHKTIYFEDHFLELNESQRGYAFYTLNGIAKRALNSQANFIIKKEDFIVKQKNINFFKSNSGMYNMKDYDFSLVPSAKMVVSKGNYILGPRKYIEIIYWYYFDKIKFKSKISELLKVGFYKLDE